MSRPDYYDVTTCPHCRADNLHPVNHVEQTVCMDIPIKGLDHPPTLLSMPGGPVLRVVPKVCRSCAYIALFSMVLLNEAEQKWR